MPNIVHNCDDCVMEVVSDEAISLMDPLWISFLKNIKTFKASVDLTHLIVNQKNNLVDYKYEFTLQDGRIWKQEITVPVNGDPASMTFNVTAKWKLSEFMGNRSLRDVVILMIQSYKVTKIEVSYT